MVMKLRCDILGPVTENVFEIHFKHSGDNHRGDGLSDKDTNSAIIRHCASAVVFCFRLHYLDDHRQYFSKRFYCQKHITLRKVSQHPPNF